MTFDHIKHESIPAPSIPRRERERKKWYRSQDTEPTPNHVLIWCSSFVIIIVTSRSVQNVDFEFKDPVAWQTFLFVFIYFDYIVLNGLDQGMKHRALSFEFFNLTNIYP